MTRLYVYAQLSGPVLLVMLRDSAVWMYNIIHHTHTSTVQCVFEVGHCSHVSSITVVLSRQKKATEHFHLPLIGHVCFMLDYLTMSCH